MVKIVFYFMSFILFVLISCTKVDCPVKIRIGASPVLSSAGIFLAKEHNYFKQEGVCVEIISFKKSGAPMISLLATKKLEVGGGNLSTGLWKAINDGLKISLVADKGHIEKGHSYIALLVRKDLVDSGKYKTLKDLKGFKMALTSMGGVSQEILAERFLHAGGLSLKDISFVKMSYSEMNIALAEKQIDATVQLEPYLAHAENNNIAKLVALGYSVYPDQQSAAIFYAPHFIKEHANLAYKFMVAYIKGVRDYENAFIHNINKKEVISKLKKYVKIDSDEIWNKVIPIGLNPNGYINTESLSNDIKWYFDKGYIKVLPKINTVIDHNFVDKALKKLGPFKTL